MTEKLASFLQPAPTSRRGCCRVSLLSTAALAVANSPISSLMLKIAEAAAPDLVNDTLNGFLPFIVPGPDAYSQVQGAMTPEPGGVDANVSDVLDSDSLHLSVPKNFFRSLSQFAPLLRFTRAKELFDMAQPTPR